MGEGEGQDRRNRNMCRSTALAHNLSTHIVWILILFLYALPRRRSPYPSLRGATVLKCVTIDYYAAIREVVYNLHTIRSNKDGLFKASPKKKKKKGFFRGAQKKKKKKKKKS